MKSKQSRAISATTAASAPAAGAVSDAPALPPSDYPHLLTEIKGRIRTAQVKATLSANREMILMYWDIGRMIAERQEREGWGAAVIPRLARDIRNEMPEVKGFSARNIRRMAQFYSEYSIWPQAAAKLQGSDNQRDANVPQLAAKFRETDPKAILQQLAAQLPWFHNIILMEKVKDLAVRLWYMQQTLAQGWSRNVLALMIQSRAHERQGKAVSNFAERLPPAGMRLLPPCAAGEEVRGLGTPQAPTILPARPLVRGGRAGRSMGWCPTVAAENTRSCQTSWQVAPETVVAP